MRKRLSCALAAAGIASRRKAEEIIFSGRVRVNGKTVLVPQTQVSWETDSIALDGTPLKGEENKVRYLLHKPTGFICSSVRIGTKKIVLDLFPKENNRLFTVGRLDRDTSGLLLVTNDGHFAQKVIHPSAQIPKEYLVKVLRDVHHQDLVAISGGLWIENAFIRPLRVVKVRRGTLKITVMEGKKREVRLLVEKANLPIGELKRIRIGGLHLGSLPEGAFRPLTEGDLRALFSSGKPEQLHEE